MIRHVRSLQRVQLGKLLIFHSSRRFHSTIHQKNADNIGTLTSLSLSNLPKSIETKENDDQNPKSQEVSVQDADLEDLPPTLAQVRLMMNKYKDYVIITQLGSFYELYFEHAVEYSSKLNLTLAKKAVRGRTIPMAGFPLSQIDRHLKVLVQDLNVGVAIVEQFKNETSVDNEVYKFTRRLTRIITPGTLIDEAFINQKENNYLLSIEIPESAFKREALEDMKIGLAWSDISIGLTFVQETTLRELLPTINQIGPSEILLSENMASYNLESGDWYPELVELKRYFRKYQSLSTKNKTMDLFFPMFDIADDQDKATLTKFNQKETAALKNLLQYIEHHLPESTIRLQIPVRRVPKNIMQIDARTSDALELHKTFKDESRKGSLIHTIRRTVTDSGSRLLSQWVLAPSTDSAQINKRQSLVTLFYKSTLFRTMVISKLSETHDISRIVQRFVMGRGTAIELIQLAHTIKIVQELQSIIGIEAEKTLSKQKLLAKFLSPIPELEKISTLILENLNEDELLKSIRMEQEAIANEMAPDSIASNSSQKKQDDIDIFTKNLWNVKPQASPRLQKAHQNYNELIKAKESMLNELNSIFLEKLKFKSVELKNSPSLGYQLHVKTFAGSLREKLKEQSEFHILSSSKSTLWISYRPWRALGEAIEISASKILFEEQLVIKQLQKRVVHQSSQIRTISDQMDLLDVTSSFAVLAQERNLVCPKVDRSLNLDIKNGRHLVVEAGLRRSLKNFTPNDYTSSQDKSMWIVSGPNMGGKSTFLRQNAIIVILAQIGSYVPAESAKIGIVDKIFSRVGAADDLYNDMSTFMVEMIETSYILKGATERSLAILDEVGRGTSGQEGLAIAFATLHHMLNINKCRALFATHFGGELHRLLQDKDLVDGVMFKLTKAQKCENGRKLIFNHKLQDGVSTKSFAIEVAGMAGFPTDAVNIARETLEKL